MANKLYAQYKGKSKITAWSEIPKTFADQVVDACDGVKNSYDIDNNSGDNLDVIGLIVDQDRDYIETMTLPVYEMNDVGDVEFGDDTAQMSAKSITDDSELSDEYYHYLLKAKIAKNNGRATLDSILTVVNTAIPDMNATRLVDGEDMSFSIEFYGEIDEIARSLLINGDIVPTPQGVKFNGFLEGVGISEMNSDGDFEFGDESAEMVGFIGV